MTFRGWTYPLEDDVRAFESAGLRIDVLREPLSERGTPSDTTAGSTCRSSSLSALIKP